jgi:hypothetical protein
MTKNPFRSRKALLAALLLFPAAYAQQNRDTEVHLLKVQGNVYMLVGAGANITVQLP